MYIELKNVYKKINGAVILDNISYKFESGKIYGLKGKNGCGKTMLMRSICGLIVPNSGIIDINGNVLHKDISFPPNIGALIENPAFLDSYTGFENLRLLADIGQKTTDEEIYQIMECVGLDPKDKKVYRKYSLGMKQKLGIACACMGNPNIIILDEPINALDIESVKMVKIMLYQKKESGAIIIVACHDKEELENLADIIIPIKNGRIINEE